MKLWIRSQDKTRLAKVSELKIYCSCEEMPDLANYYIEDEKGELGCYKPKERALEVLDEIQNKIEQFNTKTDYNCTSNVYEMPQE